MKRKSVARIEGEGLDWDATINQTRVYQKSDQLSKTSPPTCSHLGNVRMYPFTFA